MKVILLEDVEGLGTRGDLVEVADGYGRNYLVPRGLAQQATKGNMKALEERRRVLKRRLEKEQATARELAERLASLVFTIEARAGETGRLFGSVTSADIAEAVQAQAGVELDRRRIELEEPIKAAGRYQVPVRLYAGVTATLQVEVKAEGASAESGEGKKEDGDQGGAQQEE